MGSTCTRPSQPYAPAAHSFLECFSVNGYCFCAFGGHVLLRNDGFPLAAAVVFAHIMCMCVVFNGMIFETN